MKKGKLKRYTLKAEILLLVFVLVFMITSCGNKSGSNAETIPADAVKTTLGEGNTKFDFTVTDADGNVTYYEISTDKKKVGEALVDCGLISGESGSYGLYVKTVAGLTYDYDTHGKYWAFFINGSLAPGGVDKIEIKPGEIYSFKVQ